MENLPVAGVIFTKFATLYNHKFVDVDMREEDFFADYDDDAMSLVWRFEKMLEQQQHHFFDVDEFESIIDFYISNQNERLAKRALELACKMHPYSTEIRLRKAEFLILEDGFSEALAQLSIAESLAPENSDVHFLKGEAFMGLKRWERAHEAFKKSIALSTEDTAALLLNIALLYREQDDMAAALPYLLLAYDRDRTSLSILFELGYCYDVLGNFDQSERFYQEHLDIDPFSTSVWYNLGILYVRNGEYAKGIDAYEMALAVEPNNTMVMHNLGNAYMAQEEYGRAVDIYAELVGIDDTNPWVYISMGECYHRLGNDQEAIASFDRVLETNPPIPDAYYGKALVYLYSDRFYLAKENIDKAVALEAENYDFLLILGKVNLELGKHSKATEAYINAIAIDDEDHEAYVGLAEVYLDQKAYEKVGELYNQNIHKFPDAIMLKVIYSAALYFQGLKEEALQIMGTAKNDNSDAPNEFLNILPNSDDQEFVKRLKSL